MGKKFIITPINDDGTVGRAIYVHKRNKTEEALLTIFSIVPIVMILCIVLFVLRSAIEVYW